MSCPGLASQSVYLKASCPACQGYPTCRGETTRPPELSRPLRRVRNPNINGLLILQRNTLKVTSPRVTRGRVVSGSRDHINGALGPIYMVSGARDNPPPKLPWSHLNPGAFDFFETFWSNFPLCCQFRRSNPPPSKHVKATVQNFFPRVKPFMQMYIFCINKIGYCLD